MKNKRVRKWTTYTQGSGAKLFIELQEVAIRLINLTVASSFNSFIPKSCTFDDCVRPTPACFEFSMLKIETGLITYHLVTFIETLPQNTGVID